MTPTWTRTQGDVTATLYLGDCLEILPTLEKGSIDAVVTDPPYGHNNNNGDLIARREEVLGVGEVGEPRPIQNDGADDAARIVRAIFAESARILPPGACCCCCCGGGGPDPQFARWSLWMDEFLVFKQMVVWDKGPMGMGWHYRRSYETVLVGQRRGAACRWFDETNAIENIIRPGAYGIAKIIPSADQHPTEKPPALAAHFLRLHTREGDTALDPCMGHGSFGIACVKIGRSFVGIEIEPKYFEIAKRRINEAFDDFGLFHQEEERQEVLA